MAVYVDNARNPYRGMKMCHMLADSVEELHGMAERVGLRRAWFQNSRSAPHYDLCLEKRALAIRLGAVLIDRRGVAAVIQHLRAQALHGHTGL